MVNADEVDFYFENRLFTFVCIEILYQLLKIEKNVKQT